MIYCGNNANHQSLLNGQKRLGTRYECLMKGKAIGLSQPVDPNFMIPYSPIVNDSKYCGNTDVLPNGYNRFGSLDECYRVGVGVGKRVKASGIDRIEHINMNIHKNNPILVPLFLFLSIFSIFFMSFYFIKPSIITKTKPDGTNEIDWFKFVPYLFSFSMILIFILYFNFR